MTLTESQIRDLESKSDNLKNNNPIDAYNDLISAETIRLENECTQILEANIISDIEIQAKFLNQEDHTSILCVKFNDLIQKRILLEKNLIACIDSLNKDNFTHLEFIENASLRKTDIGRIKEFDALQHLHKSAVSSAANVRVSTDDLIYAALYSIDVKQKLDYLINQIKSKLSNEKDTLLNHFNKIINQIRIIDIFEEFNVELSELAITETLTDIRTALEDEWNSDKCANTLSQLDNLKSNSPSTIKSILETKVSVMCNALQFAHPAWPLYDDMCERLNELVTEFQILAINNVIEKELRHLNSLNMLAHADLDKLIEQFEQLKKSLLEARKLKFPQQVESINNIRNSLLPIVYSSIVNTMDDYIITKGKSNDHYTLFSSGLESNIDSPLSAFKIDYQILFTDSLMYPEEIVKKSEEARLIQVRQEKMDLPKVALSLSNIKPGHSTSQDYSNIDSASDNVGGNNTSSIGPESIIFKLSKLINDKNQTDLAQGMLNIEEAINLIKAKVDIFINSVSTVTIDSTDIADIEFNKSRQSLIDGLNNIENEFASCKNNPEINCAQLRSIALSIKELADGLKTKQLKLSIKSPVKARDSIKKSPLINLNDKPGIIDFDDKSHDQAHSSINEISDLKPISCMLLAKQLQKLNIFMNMHDFKIRDNTEKLLSLREDYLKPFILMISASHPLYKPINTLLNDVDASDIEAFASLYNTIKRDAFELENYAKLHTTRKPANYLFSPNSYASYLLTQANQEINSPNSPQSKRDKILKKCIEHHARMQIVIGTQNNNEERRLLSDNASKLGKTIKFIKTSVHDSKSINQDNKANQVISRELAEMNLFFPHIRIKQQDTQLKNSEKTRK